MSRGPRLIKSEREELDACELLLEPVTRAMAWKLRDVLRFAITEAEAGERERCAKVAEAAADEWWKSLKAKDAGLPAVDFGSLPDHIVSKIRAPIQQPASQPE